MESSCFGIHHFLEVVIFFVRTNDVDSQQHKKKQRFSWSTEREYGWICALFLPVCAPIAIEMIYELTSF